MSQKTKNGTKNKKKKRNKNRTKNKKQNKEQKQNKKQNKKCIKHYDRSIPLNENRTFFNIPQKCSKLLKVIYSLGSFTLKFFLGGL